MVKDKIIQGKEINKVFKSLGIPTRELKCGIETAQIKTKLKDLDICIPPWFKDTFTQQEIFHKGKKWLVNIKEIENRSTIDIGISTGHKNPEGEELFERAFTYGLITKDTAEIYPSCIRDIEVKEVIDKAIETDAKIRLCNK